MKRMGLTATVVHNIAVSSLGDDLRLGAVAVGHVGRGRNAPVYTVRRTY